MDIEFEDVTVNARSTLFNWAKKERTLLKSISGRFKAGELSAILGPSGAGKTTLLNALSGYRCRAYSINGELKVNGQPRNEAKFRRMSCYITQEDLLVPYLSVDEVMAFAASLKLPYSYTRRQKESVIADIQTMLDLKTCKQTRSEALSGGQKKRVSIALELINNLPVLFLDEPTSGLDNVAASNLIKLLRNLAHQGRTIVCTIHQPSASMFSLFDSAYVLASGQCIYQGATQEIVPFLESSLNIICPTHYNPADYVIEVAEDEVYINMLSKAIDNGKLSKFKRSKQKVVCDNPVLITGDIQLKDMHQSTSKDSNFTAMINVFNYGCIDEDLKKESCSEFSISSWAQFYILLSRMLLQMSRNKLALCIGLCTHIGCGVFMGLIFYQFANHGNLVFSQLKLTVAITVFLSYTHAMVPTLTYPFDVKLLKKEQFNHWYRIGPYYAARTLSTLPNIFIFSLIFSLILYPMFGLPPELNRFLVFYSIGVIVSLIAEAMGRTFGALFNVTNCAALGPVCLTPFIAVSVYGLDFMKTIPTYIYPLLNLSFIRSATIAYVMTIFGMDRGKLDCSDQEFCWFADPKVPLSYMMLQDQTPWDEIKVLLLMLLIFRVFYYLALKWRLNS